MRWDTPRNNKLLQQHHAEGGEIVKQYLHCRSGYHWVVTLLLRESVQETNFNHGNVLFTPPRQPQYIGKGWTKQIITLVLTTIHVEE